MHVLLLGDTIIDVRNAYELGLVRIPTFEREQSPDSGVGGSTLVSSKLEGHACTVTRQNLTMSSHRSRLNSRSQLDTCIAHRAYNG